MKLQYVLSYDCIVIFKQVELSLRNVFPHYFSCFIAGVLSIYLRALINV